MRHAIILPTFAALTLSASSASALVNPFTEDFVSDSSNWFNAAVTGPVDWSMVGGPDGGSHATTVGNFLNNGDGDMPALFRGEEGFGSSGGAFVGDWIGGGVTELSFAVRHNAPVPLTYFARFAPSFAPGANAVEFVPVLPNVWTTITVQIDPMTPFFYEGTTFGSTFSNIGRVQIGLFGLTGLAGVDQDYTFDLDKVTITPTPSAAGVLALGLVAAGSRRRR
ncbi:MAG: hypothetical protein H6813_00305 [Phycisphaeraceae bacterium]|nr:hypothetical protein [Phycisphaeraceae bacterium]MCB9847474.1 hypothetical protein [Phycisphaeraceae bacterium]